MLEAVTLDVPAAEDEVTVEADPVLGPVATLGTGLPHTDGLWPGGGEGVKVRTPGQGVHCEPSGRQEGGQAGLSSSSSSTTPARTSLTVLCHLLLTGWFSI